MTDPPPARPKATTVAVLWPDGHRSDVAIGSDWLRAAMDAGQVIPSACMGGRCGACEIEVNGQVVRACVSTVPPCRGGLLQVELATDPAW